MMSTTKEKDTSDTLRRSTRSSRAKPPAEVEDTSSSTELRRSTSGRGRSKSLAKAKGKELIEVILEADEDEAPRAAVPKKQRVKGKENVAEDVKAQKPTRKTKTLRPNDTDEENRQPKRNHPKKAKAVKDESTSGVDSEKEAQPTVKRRNIVPSTSSVEEETDEEMKLKKGPRTAKPNRKAPIAEDESSDQLDDANAEGPPRIEKKPARSKPLHKPRAKPERIQDSDGDSGEESKLLAEQTTDPPPPVKLSKGKSAATSGATEAEFSQSSDHEKTTAQLSAPSADTMVLHPERSRWQTLSGSSSSKLFPSTEENVEPVPGPSKADTADVPMPLSYGNVPEDVVDMTSATPPTLPAHSPQRPTPKCLSREESSATPPPASSSLLSASSTTSTTRVESHTDAETLVESLPLQVNGTQLTEEERLMTVEEWIRQEIEVHYEHLRRDGETKIRLFKARAEEVRRQIESL
ncbi:hypothetical protein EI94DRAFT_1719680 [Lactarius quietus]|nr:hypothetical protein EI94DRAFT_1719680 [Lactarius quietus]